MNKAGPTYGLLREKISVIGYTHVCGTQSTAMQFTFIIVLLWIRSPLVKTIAGAGSHTRNVSKLSWRRDRQNMAGSLVLTQWFKVNAQWYKTNIFFPSDYLAWFTYSLFYCKNMCTWIIVDSLTFIYKKNSLPHCPLLKCNHHPLHQCTIVLCSRQLPPVVVF